MSVLSVAGPGAVRPLRRSEYDRLVDAGSFAHESVELLEGYIVAMSPQGTRHAEVIARLAEIFFAGVRGRARVKTQSPFSAADDSEPEPDVALVPVADYSHAHPAQAFLVIEVSETSLQRDRLLKGAIYARAGVPEYWIVNIPERTIEVHREPSHDGYRRVTAHGPGSTIAPEAFADIGVDVAAVIPE